MECVNILNPKFKSYVGVPNNSVHESNIWYIVNLNIRNLSTSSMVAEVNNASYSPEHLYDPSVQKFKKGKMKLEKRMNILCKKLTEKAQANADKRAS